MAAVDDDSATEYRLPSSLAAHSLTAGVNLSAVVVVAADDAVVFPSTVVAAVDDYMPSEGEAQGCYEAACGCGSIEERRSGEFASVPCGETCAAGGFGGSGGMAEVDGWGSCRGMVSGALDGSENAGRGRGCARDGKAEKVVAGGE